MGYRRLWKLNFEQKNNKLYLRRGIMNKKILSVVVLILFSTFSFAITVYADRWSPTESPSLLSELEKNNLLNP